jgi:hypothetical protein
VGRRGAEMGTRWGDTSSTMGLEREKGGGWRVNEKERSAVEVVLVTCKQSRSYK